MTEIEITDMREYPRMIRPGFIETMVRVTYRTEKGYIGTIEVPKPIATPTVIEAKIKESVTDAVEMIGTKLTL